MSNSSLKSNVRHTVAALLAVAVAACAESPTAASPTSAGCPIAARLSGDLSASMSRGTTSAAGASRSACEVRAVVRLPLFSAIAITENAMVLGQDQARDYVVWTKAGQRKLQAPTGTNGYLALDINEKGEVLGRALFGSETRIIIWNTTGVPTLLPAPGGDILDLNDNGDVLGTNFVRFANGEVVPFTAPAGAGGRPGATRISNAGVVIGTYETNGGQYAAFEWSRATGSRTLFTLPRQNGSVRAANDRGHVVAMDAPNLRSSPDRAYYWDGTTLKQLDVFQRVEAISPTNEILGTAILEGNQRVLSWTSTGGTREIMERGAEVASVRAVNSYGDVLGMIGNTPVIWTWAAGRWR